MMSKFKFEKLTMKRQKSKTIAIAAILFAGTAPIFASPALARVVDGCTAAPHGYVCVQAVGKRGSTSITKVGVSRGKVDKSFICKYRGEVRVLSPSSKVLWKRTASRQNCAIGRAWFNFDIKGNFPNGSRVCSRFYEGGQQQGGSPCITLKSK